MNILHDVLIAPHSNFTCHKKIVPLEKKSFIVLLDKKCISYPNEVRTSKKIVQTYVIKDETLKYDVKSQSWHESS